MATVEKNIIVMMVTVMQVMEVIVKMVTATTIIVMMVTVAMALVREIVLSPIKRLVRCYNICVMMKMMEAIL
jgi:hypothetical protein